MVSSDGWWSENGESVPVLVEIYFIYAVNTCQIAGIPFQSLTVMNTLQMCFYVLLSVEALTVLDKNCT